MHALRKLAREIHRRSVWQVLAAYLLFGAVSFEAVQLATHRIGLPGWTPTMALVLLVLGLPVTIATAVVQGGIPWLRIEDVVDPNELEGLTPEQVHVIPHAHPLHGQDLLTWKNAVLLGVGGLALLVTSVVAYMTMWVLGIGPVGSLVAQGVVRPSDSVLVAHVENRTDRIGLGEDVTEALRVALGESTLVSVLGGEEVADALDRMGRSPDTRVTATVARELAGAEGIPAVVEGDVARVGTGYRLTVSIVIPPSPSPVSRYRQTVDTEEDLIPAIDELARKVRAKFGESLRVVGAGIPLVERLGPTLDRSGR